MYETKNHKMQKYLFNNSFRHGYYFVILKIERKKDF